MLDPGKVSEREQTDGNRQKLLDQAESIQMETDKKEHKDKLLHHDRMSRQTKC